MDIKELAHLSRGKAWVSNDNTIHRIYVDNPHDEQFKTYFNFPTAKSTEDLGRPRFSLSPKVGELTQEAYIKVYKDLKPKFSTHGFVLAFADEAVANCLWAIHDISKYKFCPAIEALLVSKLSHKESPVEELTAYMAYVDAGGDNMRLPLLQPKDKTTDIVEIRTTDTAKNISDFIKNVADDLGSFSVSAVGDDEDKVAISFVSNDPETATYLRGLLDSYEYFKKNTDYFNGK